MNRRIQAIAAMVQPGSVVADIGTDHAQLPILLVRRGISPKAYACDIAAGPLQTAARRIGEAGLTESIQTVLGDGLAAVGEDATCAVIAGMGYYTAAGILERGLTRLAQFRQILIEVNCDVDLLRRWISAHCFTITDEQFVADRGHGYTILSLSLAPHPAYSAQEILCGPVLMTRVSDEYAEYCRQQAAKLTAILAKKRRSDEASKILQQQILLWQQTAVQVSAESC